MLPSKTERLEHLVVDAQYLQELANEGMHDQKTLFDLTSVAHKELYGIDVIIRNCSVETVSVDDDLNLIHQFVPSSKVIQGAYRGLRWRVSYKAGNNEPNEPRLRLCHAVAGEEMYYCDEDGNDIAKTLMTYVDVKDAQPTIASFTDSHDYRVLRDDIVCAQIDEIAMNEVLSLQQKADRIAQLFERYDRMSPQAEVSDIDRQRISYLNHLGLFEYAVVVSTTGYQRLNSTLHIKEASPEQPIFAVINQIGLDYRRGRNGYPDTQRLGLSFETEIPPYGNVSVPHIRNSTLVSLPD